MTNAFDLFWDANRGNEHKQSRALGLLEKGLSKTPNDIVASVCKACLMIQMAHEWDSDELRKSAISVALDIIKQESPATSEPVRCKIEFAFGISLAQLPSEAGFDSTSSGILQHLVDSPAMRIHLTSPQQLEAFAALGAVCDANGDAAQAREAFIKARAYGLTQAADIFGDYQQLKALASDR
jgi:hypothetical protein